MLMSWKKQRKNKKIENENPIKDSNLNKEQFVENITVDMKTNLTKPKPKRVIKEEVLTKEIYTVDFYFSNGDSLKNQIVESGLSEKQLSRMYIKEGYTDIDGHVYNPAHIYKVSVKKYIPKIGR